MTDQILDIVINAGRRKVRGILERPLQIDDMSFLPIHFHNGQNELFRLVQRRQNFIFTDSNSRSPFLPSFYFYESEGIVMGCVLFGFRYMGFHIIAAFFSTYIPGNIPQFRWFYNLFWGAKVTVQMRVLSAPTFFQ